MKTPLLLPVLALAGVAVSRSEAPPRGWNSYDSFTANVNETQFLAQCQALADTLLPHGFDTCVIDYLWYQTSSGVWSLDDYCRPIPDVERWPSSANGAGFRPIADKVHAMGLKFGIHIMRGTSTYAAEKNCRIKGAPHVRISDVLATDAGASCPWKAASVSINVSNPGGQAFYDSLYEQYAVDWQVDFIKNDCVFRSRRFDEIHAQSKSITKVASMPGGRPVIYSLSPGQSSDFAGEAAAADEILGAVNMYRITNDDWDEWQQLKSHFDAAAAFASRIGRPGLLGRQSFPDLDMLPLGYITQPGDQHRAPNHWTNLTREEQRLQMSLWCIVRSPLFFGGDMTRLGGRSRSENATFTLELLTNDRILRINAASTKNRQIMSDRDGNVRVWAAELPEGVGVNKSIASGGGATFAAGLFNIGDDASTIDVTVPVGSIIGNSSPPRASCSVTDLWTGETLGSVSTSGNLTVAGVPRHGARMMQLKCGGDLL